MSCRLDQQGTSFDQIVCQETQAIPLDVLHDLANICTQACTLFNYFGFQDCLEQGGQPASKLLPKDGASKLGCRKEENKLDESRILTTPKQVRQTEDWLLQNAQVSPIFVLLGLKKGIDNVDQL